MSIVSAMITTAAVLLAARGATAQGHFDSAFGTGGVASYALPVNENIVGADAQDSVPLTDKIVVATIKPGTYIVRRFDKDTGALDTTFNGTGVRSVFVGGAGGSGAMTVKGALSAIFVAGQGSAPNICTVVKVAATGSAQQIVNMPLPAPYTICNISSAQINGGLLYLSGVAYNGSTSKLALLTMRLKLLPTLALDSTWTSGASAGPGRVITNITATGANVTQSVGIAFDTSKVYVAGRLHAPGTLSGTFVVGYDMSTGQVLTSGFGDRNTNLATGNSGVFLISGLLGEDMTNAGGNLFLNGKLVGQPGDNFGLVKLILPATSIGHLATYPAADLQAYDRSFKLFALNPNNVISGGQSNVPPLNRVDLGLTKYSTTANGLTSTWYPSGLQIMGAGVTQPFVAIIPGGGDLRRITAGPTEELLLRSFIAQITPPSPDKPGQQPMTKLVLVAHKGSAAGARQIWMGRFYPN